MATGFPICLSWREVPFFKPQKKIVLRNCGLISPDDIEEYVAVGGYQSPYKVLIDANPESGDRTDQGRQAARTRRRGLPDGTASGISCEGEATRSISSATPTRATPART